MGITDPLGLQTPVQQVQAFLVAQVVRYLEEFKEAVVYYGYPYDVEEKVLGQKVALWQAQLDRTQYVQLQEINQLVILTPELKHMITGEADTRKQQYLDCCKNPRLAQLIDHAVKIKFKDVNAAAEHRQMMDTHRPTAS